MFKQKQKGFTLIELLVVIAIIGILAAIVLVSLNPARNRAKDVSIKTSLSSLRAAAELDYDSDGNYNDVCAEGGGGGGDSTLTLTAGTIYKKINDAINKQKGLENSTTVCNESTNSAAYAAWVQLNDTAKWFCIDSTATAKEYTSAPGADITVCP